MIKGSLNNCKGLVITLILLSIFEVILTVLMPEGRRMLYDALADKNVSDFWVAIGAMAALYLCFNIEIPIKKYLTGYIGVLNRQNLFKKLSVEGKDVENRAGKLTDDLKISTDGAITVVTEVFIAALCLIGLILSSWRDYHSLGIALTYTVVVSLIAKIFNKPLMDGKYNVQQAEQELRTSLESSDITYPWEGVKINVLKYVKTLSLYNFFYNVKNTMIYLIVPIIFLHSYVSGEISLGDLMAKIALIDLLIANATILLIYFPEITSIKTSWKRVKTLVD